MNEDKDRDAIVNNKFDQGPRLVKPRYKGIYRGPEIPTNLPLDQWYIYLDDLLWHFRTIPREEWDATDWKEADNLHLRSTLIFILRDMPLQKRDDRYYRIKELVRNGEDFDVSADRQAQLFQ